MSLRKFIKHLHPLRNKPSPFHSLFTRSLQTTNQTPQQDQHQDPQSLLKQDPIEICTSLWLKTFSSPKTTSFPNLTGYLSNFDLWVFAYQRSCAHVTGTFPPRNAIHTNLLREILSLRNAVIRGRFSWNDKTNQLLKTPYDKTFSKPLSKRKLQAFLESNEPCFQDRVVQEVLLTILEPVFEPKFSPKSHAFRPGRNAHTVIRTIRSNFAGYLWFLKGDLSEIFDRVDTDHSSASRQQLQVLVEIPEGAIPVRSLDYTKNHNLDLNAFSTQTIEFLFYFPETGRYKTNAPNASKRGKVVAVGKSIEIEVKKEKTYATLETLTAVLTKGSHEDVLNFARTKNIWNNKVFDFYSIYWLLADKSFWTKFIEILRERKFFDAVVWQFGFYHKDARTIREYFTSMEYNQLDQYFQYVNSSLLNIDKLTLLEYNPFVNQRAHLIGDSKNRILNVQLKEQYKNFISYLVERKTLNTEHYLGLIYYLLLQDRIEDAIRFFGKIDREEVRKDHQHELQYDYFAAYIDFYMGYPKFAVAREICQKYLTYPVLSWRSLFIEVANQLAEFDGEEIVEDEGTENTEKKQNRDNAQKEEVLSFEIKDASLIITHQNVSEITLSFYKIDLEVLFSRNPFITQSKDEFSFIQSTNTHKLKIENSRDLQKLVVDIPDSLQKYNLHVELKTENKTLSSTYFSTSLKTHIIENYGQVKVLDKNDKPLSKTYVKCFAKAKSGKVTFYKDGYTDLRGRFDYATLNSNDISNIEKFAIFIMNDDFGSVIKEAQAPNKLSRVGPQLKVASIKKAK